MTATARENQPSSSVRWERGGMPESPWSRGCEVLTRDPLDGLPGDRACILLYGERAVPTPLLYYTLAAAFREVPDDGSRRDHRRRHEARPGQRAPARGDGDRPRPVAGGAGGLQPGRGRDRLRRGEGARPADVDGGDDAAAQRRPAGRSDPPQGGRRRVSAASGAGRTVIANRRLIPIEQSKEILNRRLGASNVLVASRVRGPLTADLLRGALDLLQRRHPRLRSTIEGPDEDLHFRDDQAAPIPLRVGRYADDARAEASELEELNRPIDSRSCLLRATLLLPEDESRPRRLILLSHHAAVDGYSLVELL